MALLREVRKERSAWEDEARRWKNHHDAQARMKAHISAMYGTLRSAARDYLDASHDYSVIQTAATADAEAGTRAVLIAALNATNPQVNTSPATTTQTREEGA